MVGAGAWLLGVPLPVVIFVLASFLTTTMLLPSGNRGARHRFRRGREDETTREFHGDCRDIMGHQEPERRGNGTPD